MKEANIAEMTKRNILSNALFKCEACGVKLGYGKNEERPNFYYINNPLQGGEKKETNITILCKKDGENSDQLDKDRLKDRAMYREMAQPDT